MEWSVRESKKTTKRSAISLLTGAPLEGENNLTGGASLRQETWSGPGGSQDRFVISAASGTACVFVKFQASLRDALSKSPSPRGLKPTAKVMASLRDVFAKPSHFRGLKPTAKVMASLRDQTNQRKNISVFNLLSFTAVVFSCV